MPTTPPNMVNELIMGLLSNSRMPMQPSRGLSQHLSQYRQSRTAGGRPLDRTNLVDPLEALGAGPVGARTPEPPPISRDPWFDDVQAHSDLPDPSGRQTLIRDMMTATGIEPRGSYDRYYSQLMEVEDAFIVRVARQLGLETQGLSPNQVRSLLADEFEHYSK